MLPSSNFTIIFNASKDYLRSAVLLHVLATMVLLNSALSSWLSIPLTLALTHMLLRIMRSKTPLPMYHKLTYHPGYWLLHRVNGQPIKYERATISFDCGLFILLRLAGMSPSKTVVIFNDQMTSTQYRVLKLALI